MIILRDIVQRSPKGLCLVAETKITDEEFNNMRTTLLLNPEVTFELPTIVYWFDGGNPPKPVLSGCPEDWRGRIVQRSEVIPQVNRRIVTRWLLLYKPPLNPTGEAE